MNIFKVSENVIMLALVNGSLVIFNITITYFCLFTT